MTGLTSTRLPGRQTARNVSSRDTMRVMARAGLSARAAVYVLLGVLALVMAVSGRKHETDQRGAFDELAGNPLGWVLLLIIAIGLAAYALWRFAEAAFGVVGREAGGDAKDRFVSAVRGITYTVLAVSAFSVVFRTGSSSQRKRQQQWTATLMSHTGGRWLVGVIGVVVIGIGISFIVRGIRSDFEKEFPMSSMSRFARRTTHYTGLVGSVARGVVFGLVGVLFLVAAITFNPSKARGIDGALRETRDAPFGPYLLGLVAFGLLLFGIYGFCEARWRKL